MLLNYYVAVRIVNFQDDFYVSNFFKCFGSVNYSFNKILKAT